MIEKLLASKVKIKILRFFFDFPLVKRNVREIAKECRIGFGIAANALKELNEVGIINAEKSGKEILYSLNNRSIFFPPLKKIFEIEREELANLPFIYRNLISDIIASTKNLAEVCILFGSIVTGTFSPKSDVDLFFVSNKEEAIREKCMRIEKKYGIRIQTIVIERKDIKRFKQSSLFKTLRKESLLLFGEKIW